MARCTYEGEFLYTPEAIKCLWSTKDEFNMNSSTTLCEYGKIWNNFSNLYDSTSSSQKARLRTAPAPQHYRKWGNYSMYRVTVLFVPKSERVQANTKLGARCRRKKGGGKDRGEILSFPSTVSQDFMRFTCATHNYMYTVYNYWTVVISIGGVCNRPSL